MLRSKRPVLVPTMGALHAGHAALMHRAREYAGQDGTVAVSIFINPTQFGAGEDFLRYPRRLAQDVELCRDERVDVVFAPSIAEMYPAGPEKVSDTFSMPPLPAVATKPLLEDHFRPSHFAGVVKVVARLFDILSPSHAIFGEKDYQQLRVITDMAHEQHQRWPDLHVVAHPTIREEDGLAMSSRNAYLAPEQRIAARTLWKALNEARQQRTSAAAEQAMLALLDDGGFETDYAVVRDAQSLMPVEALHAPCRALIAARIGSTRLIDNIAIDPPG